MHVIVLLSSTHGLYRGAEPRHRRTRFYNRGEYTAGEPNADESENSWARTARANRRLTLHRESCYTASVSEKLIHEIIPVGCCSAIARFWATRRRARRSWSIRAMRSS